MSVQLPFDGGVFLADKSAWYHVPRVPASVQRDWQQAMVGDQIRTCSIINFELLYSARTTAEVDETDAQLSALRRVPITDSICHAAEAAYRELGRTSDLAQRSIPFPDFLIAAAAEDAAIGVLHNDSDFDGLKQYFDFESRWLYPAAGTDSPT